MANLFRVFKARKKVWLTFLYAKLQKKRYRVPFLRLKANKKSVCGIYRLNVPKKGVVDTFRS